MTEAHFEGEYVTREELLKALAEETHISCLISNAVANSVRLIEAAEMFSMLEEHASEVKPEIYDAVADAIDSYAGLVMAISDRVREVAGLPKKNDVVSL
jgi:hypothetical protein